MTTRMSDTSPETQRALNAMLRDLPPWRKMTMVGELTASVRGLALCGLRERFPSATEHELRYRLVELLYGVELAERAYGPVHDER
jgi:hypothetical protein